MTKREKAEQARKDAVQRYRYRRWSRLDSNGVPLNRILEIVARRYDAKGEEENWITLNGTPVKVEEGQTKEEAGKAFVDKKETEQNGREPENNGGSAKTGLEGPADAGAGGLAGRAGGENAMAFLRGGPAGSGPDGVAEGGDVGAGAAGDVRASVVNASKYADTMKAVIDENPAKYSTVDFHSADELNEAGAKTLLGTGEGRNGPGFFGAVVKPDGDITGVFSNARDGGAKAMFSAIENGGNKLDAYAVDNSTGEPGKLAEFYHQCGFEPVARVPFNAEYAAPDMSPQDIVAYKHNGDSAEQVAQKYGTYSAPTKAQYDALPVMEYDDAIKYRDDKIGVRHDADDDDVIIRTADNGKKYAINTETGTIAGGLGPGSKGEPVNAPANAGSGLSPTGANPSIPGMSPKNLSKHWGGESDHSKDYPGLSESGYAKRAKDLSQMQVGEKIVGYQATRGPFKGSIVRYDRESKDWVRAYHTGPATLFKPKDKDGYFERIKSYETGDDK